MPYAIPEGVELPEGIKAGEEFDVLATFEMTKDGKVRLMAIDGHKVSHGKGDDDGDGKEYRKGAEARAGEAMGMRSGEGQMYG